MTTPPLPPWRWNPERGIRRYGAGFEPAKRWRPESTQIVTDASRSPEPPR